MRLWNGRGDLASGRKYWGLSCSQHKSRNSVWQRNLGLSAQSKSPGLALSQVYRIRARPKTKMSLKPGLAAVSVPKATFPILHAIGVQ